MLPQGDAKGMALKVLIAHTGQCLQSNPESFTSLDDFKVWVSKNSNIVVEDQIPLNSEGRHVKFPGLSHENEIFIYDRRVVQAFSSKSGKPLKYDVGIPPSLHASKPPETISNRNDLEAWKGLFMARRDWSFMVVVDCSRMLDELQKRQSEIDVIIRGASNAVRNVQKHVTSVDHKNAAIQNWAEEVRKIQDSAGSDRDALLQCLQSVPVADEIINFITGNGSQGQQMGTLENIIDPETFKKAKNIVKSIPRQLFVSSVELGKKVDEIFRQSDDLVDIVSGHMPAKVQTHITIEPSQIMHDIEALAEKVSVDCDSILDAHNPMTIPQVSKSALVHTKTVLPNLTKRFLEVDGLLRNITEIRNSLAVDSTQIMQQIFSLTSMITDVTVRLAALEPDSEADDALQYILSIKHLPIAYASFLAEGIRRKSWCDKIKADSSTLANEMAFFRDEESKRRRKWQKSIGMALLGERSEQTVPELNFLLQGTNESWPLITKRHLEDLLKALEEGDPKSTHAMEVSKIISDLDNPTRKQTKRAKATFKAGSFHENNLGRSTLLIRGDDELIRTLQDEVQKSESKFKTAESRVRRLENLLHQQSQVNKVTIGNTFQSIDQQILDHRKSPKLYEDFSRRSTVDSRRFSIHHSPDEKSYQHKLLYLEAELAAERKRSTSLQKEALSRKLAEENLKFQLDESNSTKRDLLENFEAHQREFLGERKALANEIRQLTAQKEDLEENLDRYVGSPKNLNFDHQKFRTNSQYQGEKKWSEEASEAKRAQEKLQTLVNDSDLLKKTNENLEIQLESLREENNRLLHRSERAEQAMEKYIRVIHESYTQLASHEDPPENIDSLAEDFKVRVDKFVAEFELTKNIALVAKTDRENYQITQVKLESAMEQTQEKLLAEQQDASRLREILAEERLKVTKLEAELTDGCQRLSELRNGMKDYQAISSSRGHNDSVDQDGKNNDTKNEGLINNTSHFGTLENEIRAYDERYQQVQNELQKINSKLNVRTSRAKDLTQKLYTQNDRLSRLLERLSYTVTREGRSVIIQRLPKPERSTINDSSDPGSTSRRSVSRGFEKMAITEDVDVKLINWMNSNNPVAESENYDAFLSSMSLLDIEAFCEVVLKRVKDLEYTTKKYSRDARLYREKFHMAQKEAHEKIAFKNFKEGDLALFLPTRNQATGAWAAFNVGAPHYFLKEQDSHKLRSRDWLLARIHKIEDRVVDLSKSLPGSHLHLSDRRSLDETSNAGDSLEDDNPFDLSDGLRWYLIDAAEEKPGAPTTPGLGKSTVASANIDATGSIRRSKKSSNSGGGINKTLSKNLDSGRGRNNSKKSLPAASSLIKIGSSPIDTASLKAAATTRTIEEGSEAHIIRSSSNHDGSVAGSIDRVLTPERYSMAVSVRPGLSTPAKRSTVWDSSLILDLKLESGKVEQ